MGRASNLYMKRHRLITRLMPRRPYFVLNSLRTHFRPHEELPAVQDLENPNARLTIQQIEDVQGHTVRSPDLSDIDPDFL